ncbi:tRNA (adenosine(37)-N6)-threonylcarbamoyltransferase complex transferase subunit TsaD [Bacteriovoracaceae bacterium]|nr:tRNA (adenosine(37)-N6)-threonylcarbamoyltransferase complex transferase subunit TsaD [Bacteriovoracaceae bacterium]|tara:strand:- start:109030 stop:110106 length:1077 start_codon:yes stop_codon:yes gene_type:complete
MSKKNLTVLGIETSCDDTSICILKGQSGASIERPEVLAVEFFSQETLLKKWGGVVPEIAARNHLAKIAPLIEQVLEKAGTALSDIDLIGVTTHPGLLGPLLTGLNAAKTLALKEELPVLPVNHLYAHLEAIHITDEVNYPYLGLIVSGGHSLYLLVTSPLEFEILGTTIDDAAGEAFDKGGKLIGLGYPAGKEIDDRAKLGDPKKYEFPVGLRQSADANLSYSGVKTSLRQFAEKNPDVLADEKSMNDLCASYQHAIVSALKLKMKYAIKQVKEKGFDQLPIVVGGGVACNSYLREVLKKSYKDVFFVQPKYCTDNGAMIANYALRTFEENQIPFPECLEIDARGRYLKKSELQTKRS